ncbi:TMEM175 family protein [Streptomyces sp. Je 1-4]|uniref:TMEM175 family protein n=1 Tax=Streptomyces TaxID=1883 RepID=UPI0021D95921|nr:MULTISPECIES: TMEM175 family protein [unclassified Streptomyces]UYB38491.1 TMEM175 family protein [Streptomyces sp. Je 1-4]UZQ34448.1 TMEM175 family protein [Streptomyces sp. Je 1-4] [Streptomyces sp. Je 1-4 4N24]UZQ41866.1 TMEM175 family protein [Streptomyces sp. Je 1-4] [Streptomyces sp. Je 1-4 4N24_ara]
MVNGGRRVRDDEGSAVRLLALSDGVFAIAMTLLALDISLPDGLDSDGFAQALRDVMPKVWAYALSLLVIAAFWRGHYQLFQYVRDVDGTVIRLVLLSLGLVALMPFPTTLLAEYGDLSQSVAIYSGAVAAMGATQLALTLALWKRPWLGSAAMPDPIVRNDIADLASTVLVFAAAVPLAFVSPTGAKLWWAVLIPVRTVTGKRGKRLRAAAQRFSA